MPTLKMDGQNCCALLLGLRNDFYLHQSPPLDITSSGGMSIFFVGSVKDQIHRKAAATRPGIKKIRWRC